MSKEKTVSFDLLKCWIDQISQDKVEELNNGNCEYTGREITLIAGAIRLGGLELLSVLQFQGILKVNYKEIKPQ